MSFAYFCGVNISPVAHLSYQRDIIKHIVGKIWAQLCERALAHPCSVLPYVLHCIPAAWRLGCWGHGVMGQAYCQRVVYTHRPSAAFSAPL